MEKSVVITYETIYEVLRSEKYRDELQCLDEGFYEDAVNYIKEKRSILESQQNQESIFSSEVEKTKKQLDNLKKMLKELYEKRESKIVQLALFTYRNKSNKDYANMLKEEKELYDKLIEELNVFRTYILENRLMNSIKKDLEKPKEIKTEESGFKFIKFTESVPEFVGEDLNAYGPFKSEDTANLPAEVAKLLIRDNRAKEI